MKSKISRRLACTIAVCAGLLFLQAPATAATLFTVYFDDTFNDTLRDPLVGSGFLSFDENYGDGTYLLSGLTNLAISFTIGAETWTLSDLATVNPSLSIRIYSGGTNFYFLGDGTGSPFNGAADFVNSNGVGLSTEPDYAGPEPRNRYFTETLFDGTYGTEVTPTTVPEPAALTLLGFGVAAIAFMRRTQIKN